MSPEISTRALYAECSVLNPHKTTSIALSEEAQSQGRAATWIHFPQSLHMFGRYVLQQLIQKPALVTLHP